MSEPQDMEMVDLLNMTGTLLTLLIDETYPTPVSDRTESFEIEESEYSDDDIPKITSLYEIILREEEAENNTSNTVDA
jgi:hypothetical protein